MRISSIDSVNKQVYNKQLVSNRQGISSANSSGNPNMQSLPSYSYGRDLVNRKQVSFTSAPNDVRKTAITLLNQFPLEDRLASLFQVLKHGEVIVLGDDFNKAQKALLKGIKKLEQVVKKEIFMPDKSLKHNYAFIRNPKGDIEVLNINDKNLTIVTGGHKFELDPGDSFYTVNNDVIKYAEDTINIKEQAKHDLSAMRAGFSKVFDFSDEVQQDLTKLNQKTISKRLIQTEAPVDKLTFAKIGGQDKAIEELKKSILFPIKYPDAFAPEDITRGFILHGPAGTGKTAICRALANEADISSAYISGTAFQSKWVGESEENVRAFFEALKENQPAIGVIDEIDAIGGARGNGDNYGDKLIDQLLTSITDLYESGDNVFILGLTNRYDMLDPALKRAERLSKHIYMGAPDKDGVSKILDIHTKGKPLAGDINREELVNKLHDVKAVGSDILYITKQARENMMQRLGLYEKMEQGTFSQLDMNNAQITQADFLKAIDNFKAQHRTVSRKPIGFNKQ